MKLGDFIYVFQGSVFLQRSIKDFTEFCVISCFLELAQLHDAQYSHNLDNEVGNEYDGFRLYIRDT